MALLIWISRAFSNLNFARFFQPRLLVKNDLRGSDKRRKSEAEVLVKSSAESESEEKKTSSEASPSEERIEFTTFVDDQTVRTLDRTERTYVVVEDESQDEHDGAESTDVLGSLRRKENGTPKAENGSDEKYQFTFTLEDGRRLGAKEGMANRLRQLDRKKVKKMHTAVQLNRQILEHSKNSQLVVLNLPKPPKLCLGLQNYMEYLRALTDCLDRVILVRGSGNEVITIYS